MQSNDIKKMNIEEELNRVLKSNRGPGVARFALAALGSIPFVGGAIAGIGGYWSEKEQQEINKVFQAWLRLQEEELKQIGQTRGQGFV